eukprot:3540093-Karenia_brevis.AAC.1
MAQLCRNMMCEPTPRGLHVNTTYLNPEAALDNALACVIKPLQISLPSFVNFLMRKPTCEAKRALVSDLPLPLSLGWKSCDTPWGFPLEDWGRMYGTMTVDILMF